MEAQPLTQHDEMIGKAQAPARLPRRGPAERATRAVPATLAERLPSGLAGHVAARLPPEPAAALRQASDASYEDGAKASGSASA
ncbi:DUF2267 domain-containing protein [Streptomyces sp. NPDC018610]|uniref:DUF2267 domain-containing protein n=1 Tax=Streptomyces sp. NPDC018610 TaxID=3365049 RepID=UPI0037A0FC1A